MLTPPSSLIEDSEKEKNNARTFHQQKVLMMSQISPALSPVLFVNSGVKIMEWTLLFIWWALLHPYFGTSMPFKVTDIHSIITAIYSCVKQHEFKTYPHFSFSSGTEWLRCA
ncbi:MAG: hypothetical protein IPP22_13840 [Nitrosomonas sp.]|nr:hypothetical protein [Nitrosomonas sp.]